MKSTKKIVQKFALEDDKGRGISYLRVSSARQAREKFGIETQEMLCVDYCKTAEIEPYITIKDGGKTGRNFNRDGFKQVFEAIKELKAQGRHNIHFVCVDPSRFSRSELEETLHNLGKIRKQGVKIHYATMQINTDTPEGKFNENVQYVMSAYQSDVISKKSHDGQLRMLREGERPFGAVPTGYLRQGTGRTKTIEQDPFKAPLIKEALELYADGSLHTHADMFRHLQMRGLTPSKGKLLNQSSIDAMFKDFRLHFYAGLSSYPPRGSEFEEPRPAKHKGIISKAIMDKIIARDNGSTKVGINHSKQNSEFPLGGIVHCPSCGRKLAGYNATPRGEKYPYYGCQNEKCPARFQIGKQGLHDKFDDLLENICADTGMTNYIHHFIDELRQQKETLGEDKMKENLDRIDKLEVEIKNKQSKILQFNEPEIIRLAEEEWRNLKIEKETLESQKTNLSVQDKEILQSYIVKSLLLFKEPKRIFDTSFDALKKSIVDLLFGKDLFYGKGDEKLRTGQKSLLYLLSTATKNTSFPQ